MLFRANGIFRRDLRVGEAGSGLGDLTVERDAFIGDDITVGDDATIGGDVLASGTLFGFLGALINNVQVNNANELLFDGFQSTPLRYYTGSTGSLVTEVATITTVYHWFFLVNAQSTLRTIANEGGGTITTLSADEWVIIAKISSLNSWRTCARGSLT